MNSLFEVSPKVQQILKTLTEFVENDCIPAEKLYHAQIKTDENRWKHIPPIIEELKLKAKSLGLWNFHLPMIYKEGPGFTNLEYAVLCEVMGKSTLAPEVIDINKATNTAAPDTGNMEVLAKYGTQTQKDKWLTPLLNGTIRSAFAMTEPQVASSDATNIQLSMRREGDFYILNGRKWWISGAGDPRCKVYVVMGKSDTKTSNVHKQQSIIMCPSDLPGITVVRPMCIYGYDDAPHGHMELLFENVRVPAENIILGEGRGFEVMQGRLGPGRIHHCMRAIGAAERALELHILRLQDPNRRAFGKLLGEHGLAQDSVCQSRLEIDQARYLVLAAAAEIDKYGAKLAMNKIAMAKVICPQMALNVMDRAIQVHGGAGVSQDFPLAFLHGSMRTLRIADGPDEVHRRQISKNEMKRGVKLAALYKNRPAKL
jgi:acyl-CoA dehydrogenase